jgi:formate dehydrogenase iron-sulfur subunit
MGPNAYMDVPLRNRRACVPHGSCILELPLLIRAREGDDAYLVTEATQVAIASAGSYCGTSAVAQPRALPGPGEQYRFHFDMTKCIGCKCCVVACNEQNGNPADILWRRVGEIEGGTYPDTQRHYLSMGCNHCLEPTCMTGCPVDAYTKDSVTGIVRHSADACIGCQYCTWNCSYGVPQYNAERGVVGKCDMCYGRLESGQDPACAVACPEDAIQIEIVSVSEWRQQYSGKANAPGMPSADDSLSTTRITLPARLPGDICKVDLSNLNLEQPHWPLIVMTVLTQISVGAFVSIWLMQALTGDRHRVAALASLVIALVALMASTLHLGRPIHAFRALKMWRRSWLSREVLLFTLFTASATVYAADLWLNGRGAWSFGLLTSVVGLCGVCASARLYLVPGRPAWNSPFTILEFLLTAALGAAGIAIVEMADISAGSLLWITVFALAILSMCKLVWLARSRTHELHGTWQLLSTTLSMKLLLRFLLAIAGTVLMTASNEHWEQAIGGLLIVSGEFISRYLFFVSVVPTNMASGYLAQEAA